ncbi:putative aldehyde dehydrogenase [Colletotrichum truncatum]|uniref:Aldehyde dehydrogenase n=1 Tax=Colletotrichum truncatum TaxID=5467 RepID=A0ACC3Z2X9_COLTU|nr:putative aldehyde dehydrogenase [Colletotrichum truncatum]KAF6793246.1 putative aldehyde dehydrogenase [Colletotrichum truncatum]
MSAPTIDLTAPNGTKIALPTGLYINNEFVKSTSGSKITAINPSDESEIASVEAASAEDVDKAVKAARAALTGPGWGDISNTERGQLIFKLADLVEANQETIATLETWNGGKPYSVAVGEDLAETIATLRYYAGWADKIHGETIPTTPQKFAYTIKQPIGVCGQIIPWNYPVMMAACKLSEDPSTWKLGPALACGNTVVLKPAEQTPLSILYFATLIKEAGFPPGVINIVNGYGREAGNALVSHEDVDKIAFTGSTATGRQIMKGASVNLKNITLETGGKSPLVVFKDADLDQAAKWGHVGIMSNQGQICTSTSRILVQEEVYQEYVDRFTKICLENKVGNPFDDDTFQGPQITKAQYDKILGYIQSGKDEGAKLITGGAPVKNVGDGKGFFIEPTVFSDVKKDMKIFQEEVFGPFVAITPFKTEEEAINLANNTSYGLGAALFTRDIERGHRVAARLEAGMVWINSSNDSDIRVPFGGVKQSGIGRELGEAGLAAYSQTKAVHLNMGMML